MPKATALSKSILDLGPMDHYTLIVEDAEKTAEFHIQTLGFHFKEKKCLNTGTVEEPNIDMINFILTLPENPEVFCVVTQGTNERTVFSQYIKKYGHGIHHIAYKVNDIKKNWDHCSKNGIEVTSQEIITDPISGLKQFFISREYAGYFIEIIERDLLSAKQNKENFTSNNMKKLSDSIKPFIRD